MLLVLSVLYICIAEKSADVFAGNAGLKTTGYAHSGNFTLLIPVRATYEELDQRERHDTL